MSAAETIVLHRLPLGSRRVRDLALALWATPILISAAYLWATPLRRDFSAHAAPLPPAMIHAAKATHKIPISATSFTSAPIPGSERILPQVGFRLRPAAPAAIASRPAPVRASVPETRIFDKATAIDGAHIAADGLNIRLDGMVQRGVEAKCQRLDGVMETCRDRAASRLAVLVQDRTLECHIWRVEDDAYRGRCRAGRIELTEDLIRADVVDRASGRRVVARSGDR